MTTAAVVVVAFGHVVVVVEGPFVEVALKKAAERRMWSGALVGLIVAERAMIEFVCHI